MIVTVDTKSIQKKKCKKYPSTTQTYMTISVAKIPMQKADIVYETQSNFFDIASILMSGYNNLYTTKTEIKTTNILLLMTLFIHL